MNSDFSADSALPIMAAEAGKIECLKKLENLEIVSDVFNSSAREDSEVRQTYNSPAAPILMSCAS